MAVIHHLWTQRAIQHLEAELDYYASINQKLANELSILVTNTVNIITSQPSIGRAGKYIGTREFILSQYPYIIAYRVRNNVLEILAFIHQKRQNIKSHY